MSLVAHWKMDDAAGQKVVVDSAGSNTGTAANNIVSVPGKIGSAIEFNGINDFINIDGAEQFSPTGTMSVAMWVNGSPLNTNKKVYNEGNSVDGNQLFSLLQDASNGALANLFIRNDMGQTIFSSVNSITVFDDKFHHLAVTIDDGTVKIYIDGVLDLDSAYTIKTAVTLDISTIGAQGRSGNRSDFFDGLIDDVRLYDTALTAEEVRAIFNQALRNNKWESAKSEWRYFI